MCAFDNTLRLTVKNVLVDKCAPLVAQFAEGLCNDDVCDEWLERSEKK